jgi:hypothetical protein
MYKVNVAVSSEIDTERMNAMSVQCIIYQMLNQVLRKVPGWL